MTQFEPGHHGHFERAFPKLTSGIKILLAINVVAFLIKNIGCDLILNADIVPYVGLSAANILDAFGLGLVRLATYQFFHSVDIGHLLFNMLFLYFFGTLAEGRMDEGFEQSHLRRGRTGIISLYLASGVLGGLIYTGLSLALDGGKVPVIGASGAVYGIMVYAACMFPRRRINMVFVQPEMRYFVGILVFIGVYYQLFELRGLGGSGVAHSAHLGGALWGFIAFKLSKKGVVVSGAGPVAWLQRKRAEGAQRSERREQETLDKILDKVKQQGMAELTPPERRFLEKVSKRSRK
jgi:membrane associated rhomboid family serine protease